MLVYNTTYQVDMNHARNLVIWLNESFIPRVLDDGRLRNPRLCRILTHKEPDSECFSLQFDVDSTADLHRWHTSLGMKLNEELTKMFENSVVGFSTILELINEPND